MINILKPQLPDSCRIICVSDIHTHWQELDALLKKCGYKKGEDFLFILGDILERGSDNINALRYVMKLSDNERVYIIEGNNDMYIHGLALRYDDEKFLERFLQKPGCFGEMAQSLGISDLCENTAEKRRMVYEHFRKEIDFVMALPDCIETDAHIFIHAGIEGENWRDMDSTRAKLVYRFYDVGHCADKTVVCGHYPCYNYGVSNTNNIIIHHGRRIIDIDGGAGVKPAGQINALIIEKNGSEYSYETEFMPLGEKRTVIQSTAARSEWSLCDYELHSYEYSDIPVADGFVPIHDLTTDKHGAVPACMTGEWDGKLHVWGNMDSFPAVNKGDPIWVYAEYGDYCWCITASGEVGNVPKTVIE